MVHCLNIAQGLGAVNKRVKERNASYNKIREVIKVAMKII